MLSTCASGSRRSARRSNVGRSAPQAKLGRKPSSAALGGRSRLCCGAQASSTLCAVRSNAQRLPPVLLDVSSDVILSVLSSADKAEKTKYFRHSVDTCLSRNGAAKILNIFAQTFVLFFRQKANNTANVATRARFFAKSQRARLSLLIA